MKTSIRKFDGVSMRIQHRNNPKNVKVKYNLAQMVNWKKKKTQTLESFDNLLTLKILNKPK